MAAANLEKRVEALERELQKVKSTLATARESSERWWENVAGVFKDDPLFDEILKAGQAYRKRAGRRSR